MIQNLAVGFFGLYKSVLNRLIGDWNMLEENTFEPIPAGWYEVSISSAQLKQTAAGTGEYIALRYNVLGPAHQTSDSW